ncbi:hypothetical protein [Micromonospora sp. NPDC051296]|uniref:hypothetical protein n=1 Tax=Micromonospora sp. NPDC051296 TaxID=3155046 RepID=UPI003447265B
MSKPSLRRIDRKTADRLLDGDPDALSRAGRLAALLRAARGPAHRDELAGEQAALAAFRVSADHAPEPRPPRESRLKIALARLITGKAAVVAATGLGGVALAAGTGALPDPLFGPPATPPARHAPATEPPATQALTTPASTTPGATPSHPNGLSGAADAPSPPPSFVGLCQAYTAGAATKAGKAPENPAFGELVDAAGGTGNVAEYCAATIQDAPDAPGRPTGAGRPAAVPVPAKRGHAPSSPGTPGPKRPGGTPTASLSDKPAKTVPGKPAKTVPDKPARTVPGARPGTPGH